ncbi:MAG: hypothetical protein HZC41_01710 [Chloroflexi bacterium]|nr:hypothetical protein [Chloroflexota bacterium]
MKLLRNTGLGRSAVIALALYTAVAIVTLWNLLLQFNTAVPGGKDSDYYQFLWGYWWIGHALAQGQSPLWTDYVLYPHLSNLSVHTLAPIWYPVYALAAPLLGRLGAGNLIVLLGYVISGMVMFIWLRRQLEPRPAAGGLALLGGLAYAFSPYMMTHASYIQLNLTPLWWFPLVLLLWDELAFPRRLPRPATAVELGLALWGVWLTDLQFWVWLPVAAWGYVLWTLWRQRRGWLPLLGWGLLAVAIMAALAWVYPVNALRQINLDPNEYPPAGLITLHAYSLPLTALVGLAEPVETKTLGHVLAWLIWGGIAVGLLWRFRGSTARVGANRRFAPTDDATPGTILRPGAWFWLALGLIPLVLALGPDVTFGGATLPLPYAWLHDLLRGQHRIPARFTGAAAFLLVTFLVKVWQPVVAWALARRRLLTTAALAGVTVALLADVGAFQPFPVRNVPDYAIHHQIAREPGDFIVMDVPVGTHYGWTGIGRGYFSMYYGAVHHHRMVNGWLSRIPYSTLAYYMDSPLFSWLAGTRVLSPDEQTQAAAEFDTYLRDWPVGYVIAYRDWMTPEQQTEWIGWLNERSGLCPAESTTEADLLWWRAEALGCGATLPTSHVAMGAPADWAHVGSGWYGPEVIGGPAGRWAGETATLRLTLDPDLAYELTFSALGFGRRRVVTLSGAGGFGQRLALSVNNWRDYRVVIPAGALPDRLLTLRHNGANSAQALGLSDDTRLLAAAYTYFTLRPLAP